MNSLITQKVIEQEIDKKGIIVTQEEIDAEMDEYNEYYGGEKDFQVIFATVSFNSILILVPSKVGE